MTHAALFFDFVLILVTAGALGILLTLLLYITLQSLRSTQLIDASLRLPSLLHHHALSAQTR
jgi:hypothetical protein